MKRQKKEDLPDDIDALKQLVLAHRDRIQSLEEQIVLFKHREFGKSS